MVAALRQLAVVPVGSRSGVGDEDTLRRLARLDLAELHVDVLRLPVRRDGRRSGNEPQRVRRRLARLRRDDGDSRRAYERAF